MGEVHPVGAFTIEDYYALFMDTMIYEVIPLQTQ